MHNKKRSGGIYSIFVFTLIILSLSCSSLSSLSPTIIPTQTPYPFPSGWKLILSDNFDNNDNGWTNELITDEWGVTTDPKVQDGQYKIMLKTTAQGARNTVFQKKLGNIKNFYISFDVEQIDNSVDAYYGVEFRTSSTGAYVFTIQQKSQQYFLSYSDSEWRPIIDRTTSSSINTDKPNRIGLVLEESKITIFINGQRIDSITDTHSNNSGSFGFTVGLLNGNEEVTIIYDNLEIFGP